MERIGGIKNGKGKYAYEWKMNGDKNTEQKPDKTGLLQTWNTNDIKQNWKRMNEYTFYLRI